MNNDQPTILIVGNFISAKRGIRCVCEDLAEHLATDGFKVITTSAYSSRILRLVDMLVTIWVKRHLYSSAQVDVYSGRAFYLAEMACRTLQLLDKRFILTLHGGSLPKFACRHPDRVRRLFQSACVVTAPSLFLAEQLSHFEKKISVIPNPINLAKYKFNPRRQVVIGISKFVIRD